MIYIDNVKLSISQHKYARAIVIDITDYVEFHPVEPTPNDDRKVLIKPEKDPVRKNGHGNLVATKYLET